MIVRTMQIEERDERIIHPSNGVAVTLIEYKLRRNNGTFSDDLATIVVRSDEVLPSWTVGSYVTMTIVGTNE